MINDRPLLDHFQGINYSLDSLRQATLLLHKQNLQLLAIIRDIQAKQLQLERRPGGMDLDILIEARRDHEKHRRA